MKKIGILFLFLIPVLCKAQHLSVEGTSGNLYLTHSAAAKENYYSIGRIYNISPKEIAPYNKLVLEKGLSLGQQIKIPLKENFTQSAETGADEVLVPLYHTVTAKETLTALSARYNKVPAASLKTWNGMKSDALAPGQDVIVGYLKVKKELSPLANKAVTVPATKPEILSEEKAVVKKEEAKTAVTPPLVKQQPVVKTEPVTENKPVEKPPVVQQPVNAKDFKGGVFNALYNESGKTETGTAGVFKSLSGWEDGKYYCLTNAAEQGAVVKITDKATGRFVYAKVLDVMPDLKQNTALVVRVSNAAADAIGAGADNFECTINY